MTDHPQTALPDLGIHVDEKLAELITLCWQRGIPTAFSCQQDKNGLAYVTLTADNAMQRWEQLFPDSPYEVTFTDGRPPLSRIGFDPAEIPRICKTLAHQTNPPPMRADLVKMTVLEPTPAEIAAADLGALLMFTTDLDETAPWDRQAALAALKVAQLSEWFDSDDVTVSYFDSNNSFDGPFFVEIQGVTSSFFDSTEGGI